MGQPLKLGLVGCGDIAGYTALVSRLVRQVRLVACCDVNVERARKFARSHGIPQVFGDYAEMLTDANMDVVYLAVPHHLHYEMIMRAIETGKPVFIEKPLTRTLAEGIRLIEMIESRGVKVGVNYQYRYDSSCYALARAVHKGELGSIHSVRINVPWRREHSYFDNAPWHNTVAQAGGGTLITQGSHFLDVVLWALNCKPVSAMGYTAHPGMDVQVETLAHGIVEMEHGTLVQIACSMAAAREQAVTIEVYGERGTAVYCDRPWPHVNFSGIRVAKQRAPEWGVHALQRSLAGFAHWVLDDKPFLIPARQALPVLATVEAIYRSAASGRRERIETCP